MKSFNTKYVTVFQNSNLFSLFKTGMNKLINKCSEFELSESGWTIESVSHLEINIAKYSPLKGGSYIPLPKCISGTKSCLNIRNKDLCCFLWCIMAYLFPARSNSNRVSSYPHYSKYLNISGLSFPIKMQDIKRFEKKNPDISINIYGLDSDNSITGPLYKTVERKKAHINLLYITNKGMQHFCLIKNFERLVHRQLTKHKSKLILCDECFNYFHTEAKLKEHMCGRVQTVLPEINSKIRFSNYERTRRIPIVIYGDFESLLKEYSDKNKTLNSEILQIHEASCFAYYICCKSNPELNDYVSYRGDNCSKKFVQSITEDVHRLYKILSVHRDMIPLTEIEQMSFKKSTSCHICKKDFIIGDNIVKDHDHFTGKYLGSAHNDCNLNTTVCPFIPIIFHNLSGYDCHLFIEELTKSFGRINIIPRTKEKYISITKFLPIDPKNVSQLKFIDSFNFLSTSLDKLVKTLHTDDFLNLKLYYRSENLFNLARKKGVYCYDYIDSQERYEETQLPNRSHFLTNLHLNIFQT